MIKRTDKAPSWIPINQDIKDRAKGYFIVQLLGKEYYLPITPEANKLFKLQDGRVNNDLLMEKWLRDILHGIYLQIRDTVGAEIETSLVEEMKDGFEQMFGRMIESTVKQQVRAKLPMIEKPKVVKAWPEQPVWLKTYVAGLSQSSKWHSYLEGKIWSVAFCEGYTSYINRCSGNQYSPAEYRFIRTDNKGSWHHGHMIIWTGRLTKAGKDYIKQFCQKANDENMTEEAIKALIEEKKNA